MYRGFSWSFIKGYVRQLVTPSVVAIAVSMLIISWMMNLIVSFFMVL